MRTSIVLAAFFAARFLFAATAPNPICGTWWNQERDARLQVYPAGDTFEGKIVWLKEPMVDGKPKIDKNNPDPSLRSRRVRGLVVLRGLRPSDDPNFYKGGQIYDPKNGKTYTCRVTLLGDTLQLRGYILGLPFLGRTAVWTRAEGTHHAPAEEPPSA